MHTFHRLLAFSYNTTSHRCVARDFCLLAISAVFATEICVLHGLASYFAAFFVAASSCRMQCCNSSSNSSVSCLSSSSKAVDHYEHYPLYSALSDLCHWQDSIQTRAYNAIPVLRFAYLRRYCTVVAIRVVTVPYGRYHANVYSTT